MTKYGPPQQQGSRSLDVAKGILVGLRRCEPDAAFYELVAVAHRYQVPLDRDVGGIDCGGQR